MVTSAVEIASSAVEIASLRKKLTRLQAENSRLHWSSAIRQTVRQRLPVLAVANWNLAGVNENPFEFLPRSGGPYARVADFIAAVDTHVANILNQDDWLEDEPSEQPTNRDRLAIRLRKMQAADLMAGVFCCANTAAAGAGHETVR